MTAPELEPCPFCGDAATLEQIGNRRQSTIVACTNCGARHECGEEWGHGTAWNTRTDLSQAAIAAAKQGAEMGDDIVATIKAKMLAEKHDIDTAEGRANFDAALRRHLGTIKDKWIKANAVELLRRWRWELFDEGYQYGATADEVRALRERISALEAQLDISSPAPCEIKTLRRKGREGEVK